MARPSNRMWALKLIPCLLTLLSTSACSTPVGLVRTPLGDRHREALPSLGISVDLPNQPRDVHAQYIQEVSDSPTYQRNTGNKASLSLMMHPSWSGQPFTEPEYLLGFSVWRLTVNEFEAFKRGEHWANQDKCIGREPTAFQAEIGERVVKEPGEWREYLCFRKDVRLPDGDVVVAVASLLSNKGVNPKKAEDIAAIKAILNSIKPIATSEPKEPRNGH